VHINDIFFIKNFLLRNKKVNFLTRFLLRNNTIKLMRMNYEISSVHNLQDGSNKML